MTPEEKIRQLYNCPNKRVTVLTIFHKEENKTERITIGDVVDIINHQQAELERLNNLKRFEKFIFERIHTDKEHNLTWDFATKEAEQEAFEKELEKLFDIATVRVEAIKEFAEQVKMAFYYEFDELIPSIMADKIDNLIKEMVGEQK